MLRTAKELFGFNPSEKISALGTARTGWPAFRAFLTMFGRSGSVIRCFLTGTPVRARRKFYLGVDLWKTLYPENTLA